MKNFKKNLSALMLLMFAFSMFASGCAQKSKSPASTATSQPTEQIKETETKEELKPVHLIWYTIGTPQDDQEAVNEAMSKITKEKINATVSINTIGWGEYNDKMRMLIAAGDVFDLCFTSSWANNYHGAVRKGAYIELDELLDKYGENIFKQVPKKYFDAARVNGKIYGMLNYQMLASNPGLMVKKDLAEKYNFNPGTVKSISDMEDFFKKIKENEKGIIPFLSQGGDIPLFDFNTGFKYDKATSSWSLPLYVDVTKPEFKVINILDTVEFQNRSTLLRDWYLKGYIRRDAASIKDIPSERKSGKYAAYVAGTIKPGVEVEEFIANGYEVIAVPIAPAYINTTFVIATLTAVSRTSKNPERAVMFYDLIHENKELYNLACLGIEGKHYNKTDDKYVQPIKDSGYAPNTDWLFGNQFNAYLRPGMDEDVWEKTIKFNESAIVSPLLGFVYDSEKMKNEIAQVEAIMGEYGAAITTGTIDYNEFKEKITKRLDDAGLQKIIEDVQSQLDEWLKKK